jgi:cellulose synthase/poly-beta-1,6-N-acetylglucosamine synthase-like glycosyltransferase
MFEWIIWVVSFISLFIGVFWLHVVTMKEERPEIHYEPTLSIIVPAHNEEEGLWKTVYSLVSLEYPKEKIQVVIVDHGSKDKTAEVAKKLISTFSEHNIKYVYKNWEKGHIKAHAMNEGIKHVTGEIMGCVDADSIVMSDSVKKMMPYLIEKDVGAVISSIKVTQAKNIYEKIQHLEYTFATFTRTLMSKIDTLHITQGALSIYRTDLIKKYGGFDEKTITEDLEIAMRLRYYGHTIKISPTSISYTKVPATWNSLYSQRVRWFRGFMQNTYKYKNMILEKKYGMLGKFQYPLNLISIVTVLIMAALLIYTSFDRILAAINKIQILGWEYFDWTVPTLKRIVLDLNITLFFPIFVAFLIALFIYHLAHKNLKEKWRYPEALIAYVTVYPFVRGIHWLSAFYRQVLKQKRRW